MPGATTCGPCGLPQLAGLAGVGRGQEVPASRVHRGVPERRPRELVPHLARVRGHGGDGLGGVPAVDAVPGALVVRSGPANAWRLSWSDKSTSATPSTNSTPPGPEPE